MLGRLRMTIGEALSTFRDVAAELFSKRRSLVPLATKYHHEPFEYLMSQMAKKQLGSLRSSFAWEPDTEENQIIKGPLPPEDQVCQR
jgi:hypothetical protein